MKYLGIILVAYIVLFILDIMQKRNHKTTKSLNKFSIWTISDVCFLCFRKVFYGFKENISVTRSECMEDVIETVKPFISHQNRSSGYMVPFLQIIYDISEQWFFTFITRIHFYTDWDLICIKEQSETDNRFFSVFLRGAFQPEIIFPVNFKIEVGAVEISMQSIEVIFLGNLMVKKFNNLFILWANIT